MPNFQQILIKFFVLALKQDDRVLQRLSDFDGDMYFEQESSVLVFKLNGLRLFLSDEINLDYPEFRKMIYQGNINEELSKISGRIEVHQAAGNVDDSWYRLIKLV